METEKNEAIEVVDGAGKRYHTLYDFETMRVAMKMTNGTEAQALLADIRRLGPERDLQLVPDDYLARCEQLKADFPNFAGMIDETLIPELALQHVTGAHVSLVPTVLLGPPGVGKTIFLRALADAFALPFTRMNLEASQAGFELIGSSRGWSNASPGHLLSWLGRAEIANSIFAMEELEKASGSHQFPVANILLQLLEPATGSAFADACVPELKLDIRPLNFMFTANSLDGISSPLQSRLHIIEIPALNAEQARHVALRQYTQLIESLQLPCQPPRLTEAGLKLLADESPRRQRILIRLAVGRAIAEQRNELVFPAAPPSTTKWRMGF